MNKLIEDHLKQALEESLSNMPIRFPLKDSGLDQAGSLYRLVPEIEQEIFGKKMHRDALPRFIILKAETNQLLVAPYIYGDKESDDRWGAHDFLVNGASSPYAMPWHAKSGSFRVLYWQRQWVDRAKFEQSTRSAAAQAANITPILLVGNEPEPEISLCVKNHREHWAPKWERAFAFFG